MRAQPDRQDELFGWVRAGVTPEEYWAKLEVPTVHMKVLLETADFGANEVIRLLYLLDDTPEHLLDAAVQWRDEQALGRDPNLPESVSAAIRDSFTNFKYWFDDPFRCDEFAGDTEKSASRKAQRPRGHGARPGHDVLVGEPPDPLRHGGVSGRPVLAGRNSSFRCGRTARRERAARCGRAT